MSAVAVLLMSCGNGRRRAADANGHRQLHEYFLIGSLGSWMIALGGLALTVPR